jgi:imidazolonepropionase-like amidohydrolase
LTSSNSGVAYRGATLIDGTGADPQPRATVLVEDGRISAVGPVDSVSLPPGTTTVDLDGLTLLPGLIDCHTHLGGASTMDYSEWVLEADARQAINSTVQMRELMRHGVTTIRDISRNGLHLKGAVNHGTMEGPRIVSCGPGISRTGGHGEEGLGRGARERVEERHHRPCGPGAGVRARDQSLIQIYERTRLGML